MRLVIAPVHLTFLPNFQEGPGPTNGLPSATGLVVKEALGQVLWLKMCIVTDDVPLSGKQSRPSDERKEKSRDAARERRAKEFEYFQELEDVLPSAEMLVDTQKEGEIKRRCKRETC